MTKPPSLIIAPSILSADFTRLGEAIETCEAAGADWIHVDVMDGHFVHNLTMGPFIVEACRRVTSMPIDVHLMIDRPDQLVEDFARAGASHLTVHAEVGPRISATLEQIKSLGCQAGVAINPETPASSLQSVLPLADIILVLTVHPGYSGQTFMPEVVGKITEVRKLLDKAVSPAWLEVDGGISMDTLPIVRRAGATAFVAAHAIFDHPEGIQAGVAALRNLLL